MSQYDQEILSALYKSLDYLMCEGLPTLDVERAIDKIESAYRGVLA